jgi:hypothetical protein
LEADELFTFITMKVNHNGIPRTTHGMVDKEHGQPNPTRKAQ